MFKVTMSDLGRAHATEMQEFTNDPEVSWRAYAMPGISELR